MRAGVVVVALALGCYVGGPEPAATDTEAASSTGGDGGDDGDGVDDDGPALTSAAMTTASPMTSEGSTSDAPGTDGGSGPDPSTGDGASSPIDGSSSGGEPLPTDCTPDATELLDLVNAYRGENGLPPVPHSPSLCIVGQTHVVDLATNAPHQVEGCNLHSWSDAGSWTPCCYTPDHAQAECMWIKPQELTSYPGNGYENAVGGGGSITPEGALAAWQGSPPHNEVILNQGIWADNPWGAMGAGLYEGYAVLWFGVEADPKG